MNSSDVDGFFNFHDFYDSIAKKSDNNHVLIEVGCWLGASIIYLCERLKLYNIKPKQVVAVDTWLGSDEIGHKQYLQSIGGSEALFNKFINNIKLCKVDDLITINRKSSIEASFDYKDNSVDFVFIDASHDYINVKNDILSWLPKIKQNGILAGHDYDYHWGGVINAVNDTIGKPDKIIGNVWVKYIN